MSKRRAGITALLTIVTVAVHVLAIWAVADPLQAVESPAPVQTAENEPTTAIPVAALLVAELAAVWIGWRLYQRLPERLQKWVRRGIIALGGGYALLYAVVIIPGLLAAYAVMVIAYLIGLAWVAYDLGGLVLGIVIAATLGGYLGPVPVAVLLIALVGYDYLAVYESDAMDELVGMLAGMGVPTLFVVPKRLAFNLRDYLRRLADGQLGGDDRVHVTIGIGDFALPAALSVAVFRFLGPVAAGVVLAGTVGGLIGLNTRLGDGQAHAGLPWLGGGALAGYGVMLVIGLVVH